MIRSLRTFIAGISFLIAVVRSSYEHDMLKDLQFRQTELNGLYGKLKDSKDPNDRNQIWMDIKGKFDNFKNEYYWISSSTKDDYEMVAAVRCNNPNEARKVYIAILNDHKIQRLFFNESTRPKSYMRVEENYYSLTGDDFHQIDPLQLELEKERIDFTSKYGRSTVLLNHLKSAVTGSNASSSSESSSTDVASPLTRLENIWSDLEEQMRVLCQPARRVRRKENTSPPPESLSTRITKRNDEKLLEVWKKFTDDWRVKHKKWQKYKRTKNLSDLE